MFAQDAIEEAVAALLNTPVVESLLKSIQSDQRTLEEKVCHKSLTIPFETCTDKRNDCLKTTLFIIISLRCIVYLVLG